MRKCEHHKDLFGTVCGAAVMGERGQVVVPKEARERLKSKTGDRFLVFEHDGFLVMIPDLIMARMVSKITKALTKK